MGDSDDEYDRRRRDKFRGERNDYDNRKPPQSRYDRGRGDRGWNNDRKRDYYGNNDRDRRDKNMGRGSSPPSKRRRDWEGDQSWKSSGGGQESNALIPTDKGSSSSPALMSFKGFIMQQEDSIDEVEAVRRYQEYKVEFRRTQINDFFVLHKGEEWFEEKYHPVKSVNRANTIRGFIKKRVLIFMDLWEAGYLDDLSLEFKNSSQLLKLLDRFVVKLEGGTDEEMRALDFPQKLTEEMKEEEKEEGNDEEKKPEVKNEEMTEEKPKDYTYDADTAEDDDNENEAKEPLPPGMDEEDLKPPGMEDTEEEEDKKPDIKKEEDVEKEEEEESKKEYVYEGSWPKRPHSIFIRNMPNNVTRDDLVNVCKRYPGFLRVGLSEPAPERRYGRRAWLTFKYDTNIKDVCWNLSNIRVKDAELSPAANREVSNRVRAVNGISCSPMAMQLDLNFAVSLMKRLDNKHKVYESTKSNGHGEKDDDDDEEEEEDQDDEENEDKKIDGEDVELKKEDDDEEGKEKEEGASGGTEKSVEKESTREFPEENPVIKKLPEGIEELITGLEMGDEEDDKKEYPVVVNEELRQWLDLVMMYLRVVHSIDYYNAIEYHNEEEMPNMCGILHVRSHPLEVASKKDVHEYFELNTKKLDVALPEAIKATDEEAEKLGKKNEEIEVENFIKANTQELAKDKWLCPLSGKKFRGPEFVRKHIMMKHSTCVDNVRMEVLYFNNYIYDLARPCFPEAKPATISSGQSTTSTGTTPSSATTAQPQPQQQHRSATASPGNWQSRHHNSYSKPNYSNSGGYNPSTPQPHSMQQETYGRMNTFPPKQMRRGGGNFRDRKIIRYRDLDAPEENDFF